MDWKETAARPDTRELLRSVAIAALLSAACLALRRQLAPALGEETPLLLCVLAVALSAALGGGLAGAFATLLSALASARLFLEHGGALAGAGSEHRIRLLFFLLIGLVLSVVGEHSRRAVARSRQDAERLEQSQRLLLRITETSPDLLFVYDLIEQRHVFSNHEVAALFGYSAEQIREMGGFGLAELIHPDDMPLVIEHYRKYDHLADGEVLEVEYRIRRADGTYRWLRSRETIFTRTPEGRPREFVGIAHDVTRAKEIEQELREREEWLRMADQRKDEFLAMLAHELRNPLAPLLNSAEILLMDGADPELIQRQGELVQRQVLQMKRLLDDLLDVSRITTGKIHLHRQDVGLRSVLGAAIEASTPLFVARRHRFSAALPSEDLRLDADPTRLSQIFTNLLNNAAKYTEPGGRIELEAERKNAVVEVRVRDSGMGIAPEVLASIFELFTQGDRALDRAQGGLGIGLTLVRRLVEMHGGTVVVSSGGVGKGTEVRVRLPLRSPGPG